MKIKLLIFLATLFTIGDSFASNEIKDYTYVVIWNSDGTNNVYKCVDRPVIIPTADFLFLKVNETEVQYPISEFRKFTFGRAEDYESDIQNPKTHAIYEITPNMIYIYGLQKSVSASIFSTDGKCMMSKKVSDSEISFDITGLKTGVYVVKCGEENFKFLKK